MSLIKMNQSKIFRGNSHGSATNKLAPTSVNAAPQRSDAGTNITTSNTPRMLGRIPLYSCALNAWTRSTLFLQVISPQPRRGYKLGNWNEISGGSDQVLWLLRWAGAASDQFCLLVWKNPGRLYVTTQLCVVAMALTLCCSAYMI